MSRIELSRFSKGKRPHFFSDPGMDHLLAMILELTTELSVAYERVARLERCVIDAGVVTRDKIDAAGQAPDLLREQDEWSNLLLDRLFSSVEQEKEEGSAT